MYMYDMNDGLYLQLLVFSLTALLCISQRNQPPVFFPSPSAFDILENTPSGQEITVLGAYDPEGDPITFSIDTQDFFNIQKINASHVRVVTGNALDFEKSFQVKFTVFARDDTSNSRTDKQVTVNVLDVNDNLPEFIGERSFSLPETTAVGFTIRNAFSVMDKDTGLNAEVSVSCLIDASNTQTMEACDTFSLSTTRNGNGNYSVHLTLKKPLDYEKTKSYILAAKGVDGAPPYHVATRNIVINILDAQDQPPVILGSPYSFFPYEELPLGAVINRIEVYDGDRAAIPARQLRLELLDDSRSWLGLSAPVNSSGIFSYNLTVKSRMDREAYWNSAIYVVSIRVSELMENGSVDSAATATSQISIHLLDINDNGPEFYSGTNRSSLTKSINLVMDEGLSVNTPIPGFLLSVIDPDLIMNQFVLSMQGFTNDTFQLSPVYGAGSAVLSLSVRKEANLDFEKQEYRHIELTIVATERSDKPKYSSQATVVIDLRDKNDNFPIFSEETYFVVISPNAKIGDAVINVRAVDADSNAFGQVAYSLGQSSSFLRIDRTTGDIFVASKVPTNVDSIEAELVATDGGGLSSSALLKITIKDATSLPPKFDSHIYRGIVLENRDVLIEPVTVRAVDPDSQTIRYTVIGGNSVDNVFRLHPLLGILTLTRRLQRSDGLQFNLTVEASDGSQRDTAHIIIDIMRANDYTPQFTKEEYSRTISESTAVGSVVLNITASDADGADEPAGRITYVIVSGDSSHIFAINASSGQLVVNAPLDFDIQNVFILQVEARDHGEPVRSSRIVVNITVTDVNNKIPKFSSPLYVQYMNEKDPVGSRVLQVFAYDSDRSSLLRYSVTNDSYKARDPLNRDVISSSSYEFMRAFVINEMTGLITTALPFSREAVSYIAFTVSVTDLNAENPRPQTAFAEVNVNIRQQGVGIPEFLNPPWTYADPRIVINVTEEYSGQVIRLIARDSNSHEAITIFHKIAGDVNNTFVIALDGSITLIRALDYESMLEKTVRIVVEALTQAGQRSTATLEINVININDNPPLFIQKEYRFLLTRNSLIGTVSAIDRDGDNEFSYSLTGRHAHLFSINNKGDIHVRNHTLILMERRDSFDLIVEVTDRRTSGLTSFVPVTIVVEGVNEHPPVCIQSPFVFVLTKQTAVGSVIGQVFATDQDFGDSVTYTMDNNERFLINRQTGALTLAYPLHPSEQLSTFTVKASDGSGLTAFCQVRVIVAADEGSNIPIFVNPPDENTTFYINKNLVMNQTITVIEVTTGEKPLVDVIYELTNYSGSMDPCLRVDSTTGRLYVVCQPNKELMHIYPFIVVARTNVTEISRKFYIKINDVEDLVPRFSNCVDSTNPLRIEVKEMLTGREQVIGAIKACYRDGSTSSSFFYFIVPCNDGSSSQESSRFSINKSTGQISFIPDTLSHSSYWICVNASTSPVNTSVQSDQVKVVITGSQNNLMQIYFTQPYVNSVISGYSGSGLEVTRIMADSQDLAHNIAYEISDIDFIRGAEIARGISNTTIRESFAIHPSAGRITTKLPSYMNFVGGRFEIKIQARNDNSFATMTLYVFVSRDDQLIVVFDHPLNVVREFLVEFFEILEKLYDLKFYVQKVTYHTDPTSQIMDLNRTDVHLFVLYKNGTITPTTILEPLLQTAYSNERDTLWKKYGVTLYQPTASAFVTYADSGSFWNWYGYDWIWWVIIACAVVLVLDALILILCLQYFWKKFHKINM